ncbi:MAG: hypothetical protein LBB98_00080, partial [Treponema sp.]|nr:hypothetical protein [Treponema sp.]
ELLPFNLGYTNESVPKLIDCVLNAHGFGNVKYQEPVPKLLTGPLVIIFLAPMLWRLWNPWNPQSPSL